MAGIGIFGRATMPYKDPEKQRAWVAANRERVRANHRAWRARNPEKVIENRRKQAAKNPDYWKKYYERNRDKKIATAAEWSKANPERRRRQNAKWQKENPEKVNAKTRQRQASKLQRTPAWADHAEIEVFYRAAKLAEWLTGEKWEVDHIVPLQGREVSGLHWEVNLQLLPQTKNRVKSNKIED